MNSLQLDRKQSVLHVHHFINNRLKFLNDTTLSISIDLYKNKMKSWHTEIQIPL